MRLSYGHRRHLIRESNIRRIIVVSVLEADREMQLMFLSAARLAAILAGASPADKRHPVHCCIILSYIEGDRNVGSLRNC